MATAYSMDPRVRVLADCDSGMGVPAVAKKYTVSPAWVRRLVQRRRETGETALRKKRTGRTPFRQTHADALRQAVAAQPDATLAELREKLGVEVALSTLWLALDALDGFKAEECANFMAAAGYVATSIPNPL